MATLALNSGLWVRRLLIGGSPFQGRCPASEVNDGGCPGKPDQLTLDELMERIKEAIELCLEVQEDDIEELDFVGVQRVTV
jgi:hypothetical protein